MPWLKDLDILHRSPQEPRVDPDPEGPWLKEILSPSEDARVGKRANSWGGGKRSWNPSRTDRLCPLDLIYRLVDKAYQRL